MPHSQRVLYAGKTLDKALRNIHEVIELCLEDQKEEIVEHLDAIQVSNV